MKKLLTVLIPILLVTVALFAQQLELPLVPSKPAPAREPSPNINLPGLNLPQVSPISAPNYGPEQATGLPSLSLPPVSSTPPMQTPDGGLPSVSLPSISPNAPYQTPESRLPSVSLPQTEPDVTEPTFEDFTGGWNTENFPDNIDDKDAQEIENFIWSKRGGLGPRPGYAAYNSSEIDTERIWGLYRHYQKDERNVLYVGLPDSLYVDTSQAQSGSFLSIERGYTDNEKFFDFETFGDEIIVVHEGDYPILIETDLTETFQFGFAESLTTVVQSYNAAACSTWIEVKDVDWQVNQWAGYLLCTNKRPSDIYGTPRPEIIWANDANVLYLRTHIIAGLSYGRGRELYIFGLFDYDTLGSGAVTGFYEDDCYHSIQGDYFPSANDSIWAFGYVIKMLSGGATGQERTITNIWPDSIYTRSAFDTLAIGDTYMIAKKVFWQPRLCEMHKNRLFIVTENQYPSDNEFIVFSEYNKPTYFHYDNFFTVKTSGGDKITQLATFYQDQLGYKDDSRDGLIIFKENSIFTLTFIDETNYYLTQVVEGIGCMAGQTVQVIENKYMLFLHSTGVYAFDGRTVTLISQKIDSEIEDIERSADHDECAAGYDDRHYYLSCPHMWEVGTTDAAGWGFLVGYDLDSAGAATANDLFTHKIDSAGEAYGADINYNTTTNVGYVDIATDTLGRCVGIWRNNLDNNDIYLTRFSADDEPVGESLAILDGSRVAHAAAGPITVDMDNDGNIIVCWVDDPASGTDDIWCQYVDWTTGKVDTNFVVNSDWETNGYACGQVAVGMNTNGIAVVAWRDGRNYDPETYDIYTQIYDVPDSAIGSNSEASGGVNYWSDFFTAIAVTADRYVVAWLSQLGGTLNIQKRVFNIDGTTQENVVNVASGTVNKVDPAVAINTAGNHVVTWSHYDSVYKLYDIYGMKYDGDNNAVGSSFEISGGLSGVQQVSSAVAINNTNVFVVVWQDYRDGTDTYYRSYSWSDSLDTCRYVNASPTNEATGAPEIDCPDAPYRSIDTTNYSLAWNMDYGGWSKMVNFRAGLYAPQKGLTDTINMIFSDPADRAYVYEFGKVFQDTGQDISVVFKSKAFDFNSISNQKRVTRFFLNYYLDQGSFDLTFYTDFGLTSQYTSSVSDAGGYRYARVPLDWNCRGRNFSYKIESTDDLRIDKIRLRLKVEED